VAPKTLYRDKKESSGRKRVSGLSIEVIMTQNREGRREIMGKDMGERSTLLKVICSPGPLPMVKKSNWPLKQGLSLHAVPL
jgi:hypothetical protein